MSGSTPRNNEEERKSLGFGFGVNRGEDDEKDGEEAHPRYLPQRMASLSARESFSLLKAIEAERTGSPAEFSAPGSLSRAVSRNESNNLENPGDLVRSASRQPQLHVPAWMENEMTSLASLPRTTSAQTPRLSRDSDEKSDSEGEVLAAVYDQEEESRMLRHLEQHAHLQEEMQMENVTNPQRMEQIQRENDRLLHIALRRDRSTRGGKGSPRGTINQEFSPPSPLLSSLRGGEERSDDDEGGFRVNKTTETASRRSGFFRRLTSDPTEALRSAMREDDGNDVGARTGSKSESPRSQQEERSLRMSTGGGSDRFSPSMIAQGQEGVDANARPSQDLSDKGDGAMGGGTDGPAIGSATPGSGGGIDRKAKVVGFGFARRASSGIANLSARMHNVGGSGGGGGSKRRFNHLPPSFTNARQRANLLELFKRIDLQDATLLDAIRKSKPLHPLGRFRRYWDELLALGVLYTLIAVPVEVAFDVFEIPFRVVGIFLDIVFIADIPLTFRTSYREINDEYVRDFDQIARNYLATWFALDLIAAIPVNFIFLIIAEYVPDDVETYLSLIKLLKIIRVFRLRHLFYSLAGRSISSVLYGFVFLAGFVIVTHWMACIFWKVADLENDVGSISWASIQQSIPDVFNRPTTEQYSTSFYFAMATIATLGYGDIHAVTYPEHIVVSVMIVIGATLYASVIGLVAYVLRTQFDTELRRENHTESIRTFGRHFHLPLELQQRIHQYYDFLWERKKRFSSKSLVDDLPLELRADVADAIHKKLMENNPVLRASTSFGFKKLFAARLSSSTIRIPGDVLYFEGDPVAEVFFIKKGMVEIIFGLDRGAESEFIVSRRSDGQYLGELGLFVETKKSTSLSSPSMQSAGGNGMNASEDDGGTEDGFELSEDADSEEETEFSPADHFNVGSSPAGMDEGRIAKSKQQQQQQPSSRCLHHISAVVTEFSEVNSILSSDFLQLLDQFPRERRLFKAVAVARFKRMRHLVSTRLALLNNASPIPDSFAFESEQQSHPGGFGFLGRAMSSTRNVVAKATSSSSMRSAGVGGAGGDHVSSTPPTFSDFQPDNTSSSPRLRNNNAIASSLEGLYRSSGGGSGGAGSGVHAALTKDQRMSQWKRMWQNSIAPETDGELVLQVVDRFLKEEKRTAMQQSSHLSPSAFFNRRKSKNRKPFKATEFLLSPVLKPLKKQTTAPASVASHSGLTPPQSILKTSTYTAADGAPPSSDASKQFGGRGRSRSETGITTRTTATQHLPEGSSTNLQHQASSSGSVKTTPTFIPTDQRLFPVGTSMPAISLAMSSGRRRRSSLGLPGESPVSFTAQQHSPSFSTTAASVPPGFGIWNMQRAASSPNIGTPLTHLHGQQHLELRLRALLEKVQRLDAQIDAINPTSPSATPSFPIALGNVGASLTGSNANHSRRGGSLFRKRSPLEASLSEAHLPQPSGPNTSTNLPSSTPNEPSGTSAMGPSAATSWKKRVPNLNDVRGLI